MLKTTDLGQLLKLVMETTTPLQGERAGLVAISGIDGSGKGTIVARFAARLRAHGFKVASINLGAWYYPQTARLNPTNPAEHFYQHAFRWDDLFEQLIEPLQMTRSIRLTPTLIKVAVDHAYTYTYDFQDIDIILLEGIFLFKQELKERYGLRIWIDVSFETVLQRAILRNQEGLSTEAIIQDDHTIYFAAQRLHFAKDQPTAGVDALFVNDAPLIDDTNMYPKLSAHLTAGGTYGRRSL